MKKPILYKYSIPTRFSDLDSYNHVNFKHYLDYVINSRLYYMQDRFQIGLFEIAQTLGLGFYATQSEIKYLRPIRGITFVEVESYVEEVANETVLKVPFKIFEKQKGRVFSEGRIDFSIVDVKTGWTTPITNEINNLLFENGDANES